MLDKELEAMYKIYDEEDAQQKLLYGSKAPCLAPGKKASLT